MSTYVCSLREGDPVLRSTVVLAGLPALTDGDTAHAIPSERKFALLKYFAAHPTPLQTRCQEEGTTGTFRAGYLRNLYEPILRARQLRLSQLIPSTYNRDNNRCEILSPRPPERITHERTVRHARSLDRSGHLG